MIPYFCCTVVGSRLMWPVEQVRTEASGQHVGPHEHQGELLHQGAPVHWRRWRGLTAVAK